MTLDGATILAVGRSLGQSPEQEGDAMPRMRTRARLNRRKAKLMAKRRRQRERAGTRS
jgi:hypothetical protein